MRNYSVYIHIDEDNKLIHTSGIEFADFISGINLSNTNLLILAGYPNNCSYNKKLNLEYITEFQLQDFSQEDIYSYGDFCCVDFCNEDLLETVSDSELAELLFLRHKFSPINSYKISSLNNSFAYIAHDDGWWNNLYMDEPEKYKKIISYLLIKNIKGRKKFISNPDDETLDILYNLCKQGIVLDFERMSLDNVHLYKVGYFNTMDDLSEIIRKFRSKMNTPSILYNSRNKKWEYVE